METPDMYYMCSHDLYRSMYNPQTCTSQGTAIDPEKKVTCYQMYTIRVPRTVVDKFEKNVFKLL